ncbi:MAG: ABC transporter substrate-binding protein [Fimbriimonadaceae bacterium]
MRWIFGGAFLVLMVLSIVAWRIAPEPPGGPDKVTLVWATDNNPVREAQVALFNKLNPDLHLTIDPVNNAREKVIVQSIGGVGPDLFDTYGFESLRAFVNSGVAWDITDPLREEGIIVEDLIWPVGVSSCVMSGRTYGFPANVNADAIWYNKDLFDEAGVPYPRPGWTWEELIETGKKLTQRDANGRPVRFGLYFSFDAWQNIVRTFGGQLWEDGGTRCVIDSPDAVEGLQMLQDLMYTHRVVPSPQEEATLSTQGGWGSGGITFLMGGRVAMAFGGRWWLNLIRKEAPNLRLGVVELPFTKRNSVVGGARCVLVNSKSPKRDYALRFIKFLSGPEYNQLLNDQADALAPVKSYSFTERFLHNPEWPDEDYNAVWREVVSKSTPEEVNPFVKGAELGPLNQQLDLIKANLKPAPAAARDAAKNMDDRIRRQARMRPELAELYQQLTGVAP